MVTEFQEQTQANLDILAELNELKDLRNTYAKISGDVETKIGLDLEIVGLESDLINGVRYAESLRRD